MPLISAIKQSYSLFGNIGGKNLIQKDQYNASPSLAGYLFQCRLALLFGLQMLKKKPNGHISIEKFDDIAFDTNDVADCLIQAKHHIKPKPLSDVSVDLWKTIRIWIEHFQQGSLTASDLRFNLITTATASPGSAMELLRPTAGADAINKARQLLCQAAKDSRNKESQLGREAFLKLTEVEAEALLGRINVLDQHPNLIDVMEEIEGELILLSPNHASSIAAYLEGWWLGVVGKCLMSEGNASIPVQHIIIKANELGNIYKGDNLPVDDPNALGAKDYTVDDESAAFVRQMRAVKLNEPAVRRGVQDFYRAAAQRSKWARENLLLDGEASKYDSSLRDRFARKFDAEIEEVVSGDEESATKFGRQMCHWASQQEVQFRNVVETWITAGSYHSLSDRLEIGWHPNYLKLLSKPVVAEDA
ncbi:MAG: ABC-three component system protein [Pseudoruegeria sp.]